MAKRSIPIDRLTVGMYLTGVDRSWLHTPFLRHRFLIREVKEIIALRKAGVAEVIIDTELGLDPELLLRSHEVQDADSTKHGSPNLAAGGHTPQWPDPVMLSAERLSPARLASHFSAAKQQRLDWMNRTNALFEKTRATDIVEVGEVRQIVESVLESLLERQAACLAVLGLRQPDATLQEHGLNVCTLALVLGKALGFPDTVLRQLGMGALLHDIGLTKLPRNIVKRPKAMAPAQQALYQTHSDLGVAVLEKTGATDPDVVSIVKRHHQFDKVQQELSKKEAAPDLVKLVSVVDQYDELITGQTGLTPMSSNQALTQLYQHFRAHPDWLPLVSSLIRVIGVYPLYSIVSLSTGELGVVAAITPGKAHLPLLYICRDLHRRPCVPPTPVDLIQEPEGGRRIKEVQDPLQVGIDIEQVLKQVAA